MIFSENMSWVKDAKNWVKVYGFADLMCSAKSEIHQKHTGDTVIKNGRQTRKNPEKSRKINKFRK